MKRQVNKDLKKQVLTGVVAVVVAALGFIGNKLYPFVGEWIFGDEIDVKITPQYVCKGHCKNIPDEITATLVADSGYVGEYHAVLSSILSILKNDSFSREDINELPLLIRKCKSLINQKILNGAIKQLNEGTIPKYILLDRKKVEEMDIAMLRVTLARLLDIHKEIDSAYSRILACTDSLKSQPDVRTGLLGLDVHFFSKRSSPVVINTDASVYVDDKEVKFNWMSRHYVHLDLNKPDTTITLMPTMVDNPYLQDLQNAVVKHQNKTLVLVLQTNIHPLKNPIKIE